jgi:hypothetical protein
MNDIFKLAIAFVLGIFLVLFIQFFRGDTADYKQGYTWGLAKGFTLSYEAVGNIAKDPNNFLKKRFIVELKKTIKQHKRDI